MRFSFLFAIIVSSGSRVSGFVHVPHSSYAKNEDSMTCLGMAKKIRNKQAELAKKLAMAKEQNLKQDGAKADQRGGARQTDLEMKEINDRRRFEEMLDKQTASLNFVSSDGYLSREQEEAEIDAYRKSDLIGWIESTRKVLIASSFVVDSSDRTRYR